MTQMKENILLCIKLLLITLLIAIVVYLSTIVWQITITIILILIAILILFKYFEFPYKICLFFFRGNSIGAAMVHPWKKKIIWYYKEGYTPSIQIQKHEQQHLNQIEKEGSWKFVSKYLLYLLKYGYMNNLYEIDARQAEEA